MSKKAMLLSALIIGLLPTIDTGYAGLQDGVEVNAVTNCSGMQVVRVAPGRFEVRTVEPNLPGCINAQKSPSPVASTPSPVITPVAVMTSTTVSTGSTSTGVVSTGTTQTGGLTVTNCNGTRITSLSGSVYTISHVEVNLPGCIRTDSEGQVITGPNLSHGPLLDLASTDIVNYRVAELKEQGIRFANAIRSVRMRNKASMDSRTNAYLMRNDAVVIDGKETGWVKVQGADIEVTDTHENIVEADTTGKAHGYTAGKYLRDPNTDDLVRIEQADHAYWSDITHINLGRVNVRANPWYTAPIVTTLSKNDSLYVIATVDNWSEVRNDSGSIRGYVRSDLLTVEKVQRASK